ELTISDLRWNIAERHAAVEIQIWCKYRRARCRLWVIQDVVRIDTELQAAAFFQLEGFAHRSIQTPGAWAFKDVLTQCPSSSGLRVLYYDITRRIRDCSKCANRLETGCDAETLRILNFLVSTAEIVACLVSRLPLHAARVWIEVSDDVRCAVRIKHALSNDA